MDCSAFQGLAFRPEAEPPRRPGFAHHTNPAHCPNPTTALFPPPYIHRKLHQIGGDGGAGGDGGTGGAAFGTRSTRFRLD